MRIVKNISVLTVMAAMMTVAACRKKDKEAEYNFTNHLPVATATVDIYSSKYDYDQQQNALYSFVVDANSTYRMALGSLKEGQTYYIDWYTADYEYNNWVMDKYTGRNAYVAYKAGPANYVYTLDAFYKGPARNTFLSGNDTATRWKAVGAYTYTEAAGYTSMWVGLTPDQQLKEITVRKDGVMSYTFRHNSQTVTENYEFTVVVSKRASIETEEFSNGTSYSMFGGKLPTGQAPEYSSASTDTVMAIIDNTGYEYMMVKQ